MGINRYIEINPPIDFRKYYTNVFHGGNNWPDVILTSRGRDSVEEVILKLQLDKKDVVLLPALTCDTVSIPFERSCKVVYYDLKQDYSVDFKHLLSLIQNNDTIKVIYIIHYFGFIQRELSKIHEFCVSGKITLIEDHAHSALSITNEQFADIKIYSFRKLFPTPDGGGLWFKNSQEYQYTLKFSLGDHIKSIFVGILIIFKRKFSYYSWFRRITEKHWRNQKKVIIKRRSIKILPISVFSKNIINTVDTVKISDERRRLFFLWMELFIETKFKPAFSDLDRFTVPYCFTLWVANPIEIYNYFKGYKIFLKTHWRDLSPRTLESCPISHYISRNTISLPIYPGLTFSDMKFIKDEILKIGRPSKASKVPDNLFR